MVQSSEFSESGQCIIEPLDHVLVNSNFIGCTEQENAMQYFITSICMPKYKVFQRARERMRMIYLCF